MQQSPLADYREARRKFFALHGARWPETLADEFDILAPLTLSRAEVDDILRAARNIGNIYQRAATLLRQCSDHALLEMGVPDYMLAYARGAIAGMSDCVLGRLDMARTPAAYKLLEFNADSPGFVVEAFSVNSAVCRHEGKGDPNEGSERILVRALEDATHAAGRYLMMPDGVRPNVVVTSIERYSRDTAMAQYLAKLMAPLEAKYIPVHRLRLDGIGLYDPAGTRVDVLHRCLSLDAMHDGRLIRDGDSASSGFGWRVLELVEQRRLALINPPFSFLLQNKALQAVIWNMAASDVFFNPQERRIIEQFMLPTFLDPPRNGTAYVEKPIYGSQGDTVRAFTADGRTMTPSDSSTFDDEAMVYQEWADIPPRILMTEYGPRELHVVTSCFLVGGTPTGICLRAGNRITDESAWVLPVCC